MREYVQRNKDRVRMHKLRWYYKNRVMINTMYSRPSSLEPDAYDKWYAENYPEG